MAPRKPEGESNTNLKSFLLHVWKFKFCISPAGIKEKQLRGAGKCSSHAHTYNIRGFEQEEGIVWKSQVT